MHASNVDFALLALLLVLCYSAPLPGNTLVKRLPGQHNHQWILCRLCSSDSMLEILKIMGHSSGQITHDVSHYFQSETPDAHARHHLNTTTAFKNLSLEQIMSSDHPPYKRDESLRAAAPKAFPLLVELMGDNCNGFVDLTHGLLQTSGRPIKRSNLIGTRQETHPMLSTDSPCSMEDLPENVDLPRAGD